MWPKGFHFEFDERAAYAQAVGDEPLVPGTGEDDLGQPEVTTPQGDTTAPPPAHDPGPVPYSRFKEVNDRRRALEESVQPYLSLEQTGYGVADLQRLVAWEQEYTQDPAGAWLRQAQQIDGMPDEVKQAIALVGDGAAKDKPAAEGSPPPKDDGEQEPPQDPRLDVLMSDFERRQVAEEQQASQAVVDALLKAWDEMDSKLEVATPQNARLIYIQAAASEEGTPQEIFVRAHQAYMADREAILEGSIKRPGAGTTPRSVPGSGGPPQTPPVRPRTLREATKNALAAEAAGRLVRMDQ